VLSDVLVRGALASASSRDCRSLFMMCVGGFAAVLARNFAASCLMRRPKGRILQSTAAARELVLLCAPRALHSTLRCTFSYCCTYFSVSICVFVVIVMAYSILLRTYILYKSR